MEKITNEQIILAKQFDDDSLKFIFDSFKPFIKSMAYKFFLVGSDNEDVMQEAMIALFQAIKSFDLNKDVDFECFCRNCVVLRLRSAVKQSLRLKHIPLNDSVSFDTEVENLSTLQVLDPEEELLNQENFNTINNKLIEILSKFELSVIYLLSSGMSYKEVATVLSRSTKSIDNALQRIKKKTAPLFDL